MNPEILALLEKYNRAIATMEDTAITRLNAAIDQSYRNLERELRAKYPAIAENGSLTAMQQKVLIANDLNELLQLIKPGQQQEYEQLMTNLLQLSSTTGATLADQLVRAIDPDSPVRQFTTIPIEATALQAQDGVKRLYRHSDDFASRASAIVEQGLIQQWGARRVGDVIRRQLETTKFNAERIARTEVLSALNDAAQQRYKENGIDGVMLIPIGDRRACPICLSRAGLVYEVGKIRVPLHPLCRCMVVPQSAKWRELGLIDEEFISEFRAGAIAQLDGKLNNGLSPFEKMAGATSPPEPIWKPKEKPRPASSPKDDRQPLSTQPGRSRRSTRPISGGDDDPPKTTRAAGAKPRGRDIPPDPNAKPPSTPTQRSGSTPVQVRRLEDQIRQQSFESAALFDRAGNQLMFKNGKVDRVEFTAAEIASMRGQILTHNHPMLESWKKNERFSGVSFSRADWETAALADLAEIRAVTGGYRHSLQPPPGGWSKEWWDQTAAPVYDRHAAEVLPILRQKKSEAIARGVSPDEALRVLNRDYFDEVSRRTAKELGLTYKRERWEAEP